MRERSSGLDFLKYPLRFRTGIYLKELEKSVHLVEEDSSTSFSDELSRELLPLVGRGLTGREILSRRPARLNQAAWLTSLISLYKSGFLQYDSQTPLKVALKPVSTVGLAELEQALSDEGIGCCSSADFSIVLVSDYRELLSIPPGKPYLPLKLVGKQAWFGPVFSSSGPCPLCLEQRVSYHRAPQRLSELESDRSFLNFHSRMFAWLLRRELLGEPVFDSEVLLTHTAESGCSKHRVVKRSLCPWCGESSETIEAPRLFRGELRFKEGLSGYREESASSFLSGNEDLLDPLTGIARLTKISDGPVHLWSARYHQGSPATWNDWEAGSRNNAGGKGATVEDAKAGALGEALERYCSQWDPGYACVSASFEELGDAAIHPNRCMLFSQRQYEEPGPWDVLAKKRVPRPFPESEQMRWVRVWSMTQAEWRFLPAEFVHYGFPGPGRHACVGDSNGNAGGHSLEEAALQGLLELIERDAAAIWWYNKLVPPRVELTSIPSEFLRDVLHHAAEKLDRDVWILDLTVDLAIPVYAAVSAQRGEGAFPSIGFGAHICPSVAIHRAVMEMYQLLPYSLKVSERADRQFQEEGSSTTLRSLQDHPYICGGAVKGWTESDELPESMGECFDLCRRRLASVGLEECLLADFSRPELNYRVVKVIVPGLRHFWRRLAPGRLYDVPVKLGWIDRANDECALNALELGT